MQQATCVHSDATTGTSPGNTNDVSVPSRRTMMAGVAALATLGAVSLPSLALANAASTWSGAGWIDRWHRLGCGVRLDAHGFLQLTLLAGQEAASGVLLGELAAVGRTEVLTAILKRVADEDGAVRAVRNLRAIESECVLDDDDPAGHAAWWARCERAERRLLLTPASTGKGLAEKLRVADEHYGTKFAEQLTAQVLWQLERMA